MSKCMLDLTTRDHAVLNRWLVFKTNLRSFQVICILSCFTLKGAAGQSKRHFKSPLYQFLLSVFERKLQQRCI